MPTILLFHLFIALFTVFSFHIINTIDHGIFQQIFYPPPPRVGITKLVSFILVATAFTLTYVSCNKDEITTQIVVGHDAKYDMYYKILSFIETMEGKVPSHPAILPRTTYSPADILEYIEGALNLQYTDPSLTWEDYEDRTDTFTIALTDGYASQAAVEALYEKVLDTASVHFYSISEPDRFPYLYDAANLAASSTTLMYVSVLSKVGKVHRNPTPFGENDYWSVIPHEGLCDPADDPSPYNASSIMSDVLNDHFKPYGCVFYTNETQVYSQNDQLDPPLIGWRADNPNEVAGDWVMDFRTFYTACEHGTSQCSDFVDNGVYCLAPNEMNYYFTSILGIYNNYTSVTGLVPMLTEINLYETTQLGDDIKSWECNDVFATRNDCYEGNDFPFALPICCN